MTTRVLPFPITFPRVTRNSLWAVWVLLLSIIPEGARVEIAGRTPKIQALDVVLALLVGVLLIKTFFSDEFYFGFEDRSVLYAFSAFIFANFLSLAMSVNDPLRSAITIKTFLVGYLSYVVVLSCVDRKHVGSVALCLGITGACVSALLSYSFFTSDWHEQAIASVTDAVHLKTSVETTVGHSNYIAALLVIIIPIVFAFAVSAKGRLRWLLFLLGLLNVFGLVNTLSRGAAASLLGGIVLAIPYLHRAGVRLKHYFIALLAAGVGVLFLPSSLLQVNVVLIAARLQNPTGSRLDLFNVAWHTFLQHPIVGVGPGCIYIYISQYAYDSIQRHAHNLLVNSLAEVGIVGTIPLVIFLGIIFYRSREFVLLSLKSRRNVAISLGLFISLTATLGHCMVEPTFLGVQYSALFWTLAAIIYLLHKKAVSDSRTTPATPEADR